MPRPRSRNLQARIAKTVDFLKGVNEAQLVRRRASHRDAPHSAPARWISRAPSIFRPSRCPTSFHITTAYDICVIMV